MARYRAEQAGFVNGAYISAGEEFSAEFPAEPSWAKRIGGPDAKPAGRLKSLRQKGSAEAKSEDDSE